MDAQVIYRKGGEMGNLKDHRQLWRKWSPVMLSFQMKKLSLRDDRGA